MRDPVGARERRESDNCMLTQADGESIAIFSRNRHVRNIIGCITLLADDHPGEFHLPADHQARYEQETGQKPARYMEYNRLSMMDGCVEIEIFMDTLWRATLANGARQGPVRQYRVLEAKTQHGQNGEPDDVDVVDHSCHDHIEDALLEALKIVVNWELQNDYESEGLYKIHSWDGTLNTGE